MSRPPDPEANAEMTSKRRIEGLRNLRTGYDLVAAVGFWKELHGEDLIEEYAAAEARERALREALREYHDALNSLYVAFGREFRENADLYVVQRMNDRLRRGYAEFDLPLTAALAVAEAGGQ